MDIDFISPLAHLGRFSGLAVTGAAFLLGNNPQLYMIGGGLMAAGIGLEVIYHIDEGELIV